MEMELLSPEARAGLTGRADIERRLRATRADGALNHGWIIAGPKGAGKATLAYRMARGLLDPRALSRDSDFEVSPEARVFHLVAANAHPDLFVAARAWDEKKSRYQSEITVETIRKLISFMNRTAAGGGERVAIIDTADDMNRNAANALLKVLEEPPANTTLLLLSAAPGRLVATIRSRCRRIDLPPLADDEIETLLIEDGVAADEARTIAPFARGRPGYALTLAAGEGVEAIKLAQGFLRAAALNSDIGHFIAGLTGKAGDGRWEIFKEAIVDTLSDAARSAALGAVSPLFENAAPAALVRAWEETAALISRGEGLNLDRGQLIYAVAYDLRAGLNGRAA